MATDFKVGDRVRVTHEAVVSEIDGDYFSLEGDGEFEYHDKPGTSMKVEVLERKPEPFRVGTVLQTNNGIAFKRDAGWIWAHGGDSTLDDAHHRHMVDRGRTKIVYAPPA